MKASACLPLTLLSLMSGAAFSQPARAAEGAGFDAEIVIVAPPRSASTAVSSPNVSLSAHSRQTPTR